MNRSGISRTPNLAASISELVANSFVCPPRLFVTCRGRSNFITMEQQHIDHLLERYLGLLDEYTRLRQDLSKLQADVYQNIARANFSGERGMRYGPDQYDERMRALRLLTIDVAEDDVPTFTLRAPETEEEKKSDDAADAEEETDKAADDKSKTKMAGNPLHWFGLFVPMPLRTAQSQSIQAVEQVIPRLVSVNAEMLSVEIEVRRARKRRAKAEKKQAPEENEVELDTTETGPQAAPVEAT